MKRLGIALPIAAAVMALGAGTASAATRYVDNTPATACKKNLVGPYSSIQDAVDDANKNDTIVICQGVYYENVHITTDGLKLQGQYKNGEVVRGDPYRPTIHIDGADNVQVTKLVIQGGYGNGAGKARSAKVKARTSAVYLGAVGILVDNYARNARLSFNRVLDTYGRFCDCPTELARASLDIDEDYYIDGAGIVFGGIPNGDEPTSGSGIAHDNEVIGYSTAGIAVYGQGSVVNLTRNRITATADSFSGVSGVWAFGGAKVTLLANNVANNTNGYHIEDVAPGSRVNSNIATNNYIGFQIESTGVSYKGNAAVDGGYGFSATEVSSNNTLKSNKANEATDLDCADFSLGAKTAGTANTWVGNKGALANPDPICN